MADDTTPLLPALSTAAPAVASTVVSTANSSQDITLSNSGSNTPHSGDYNLQQQQQASTQSQTDDQRPQQQQMTRNERKRRFREEQQAAKLAATGLTSTAGASKDNGSAIAHKKPLRMPASAFLPLSASEQVSRVRRCVVAYDGGDFQGFQAQDKPGVMRTVQEVIEDALLRTTGEALRLRAASRTDAGVHALGQVVAFASRCVASDRAFRDALNSRLPADVVCRSLLTLAADDTFDPRAHSKLKTYAYRVTASALRPVLNRRREWHVKTPLDVRAMRIACAQFVAPPAAKDFSSFTPQRAAADGDNVCALAALEIVEREADTSDLSEDAECQRLEIVVTGNRFVYKMVRNIVGTLVDVGRGRLAAESISEILGAKTRARAGQGAPPHGLTLVRIAYD